MSYPLMPEQLKAMQFAAKSSFSKEYDVYIKDNKIVIKKKSDENNEKMNSRFDILDL